MTLTAEQFNKLATKDEFKTLEKKVDYLGKRFDQTMDVLDTVVKKLDTMEHAFVSNMAAHDRFEKRLVRVEKCLKLKPLFD